MNQPHYAKDARDLLALVHATIEQRKEINAELANRQIDEPIYCYRCNSSPCKPSCGMMIGGEATVLKPGEHNRYPDGRACVI